MKKIDFNSTAIPPHLVQLARYKLEFLRRNPSYIKSYEKLQKTLIKKYSDWAPHDEMTPEEIDFCKKWKIGNVFAPGKSYDEWTDNETVGMCSDGTERKIKVRGFDFHRLMFNWLFPGFLYSWPILPTEPECLDDERITKRKVAPPVVADGGKISVIVDLNYSKSRLLKDVKAFINEWKKLYDESERRQVYLKFCKEKNVKAWPEDNSLKNEFEKFYRQFLKRKKQRYEPKYHFDNFDQYIKVYDLKNEGMPWPAIVKKLGFYDIQTARNYYNSAKKIIGMGIEAYVNYP